MNSPQGKREGLAGILLTALLCGGFLYWWFRPDTPAWQEESAQQLTARAAAEPAPDKDAERWVLDADFMEVALLHARTGNLDEALRTAAFLRTPLIQSLALRQIAHAHLTSDGENLARSLDVCQSIPDPAIRSDATRSVISILARLGFADVALQQASSPILKANVALVLAETDQPDDASRLAAELQPLTASLPPEEAAALRASLAATTVKLALHQGPDEAIRQILSLPPAQQPALWTDLFRLCFGRENSASRDAAAVLAAIPDPALQRQLELEAVESNVVLRLPDEILLHYEDAAVSSPQGTARITALTNLGLARRRCGRTDDAATALREAHRHAAALAPGPDRAAALLSLVSPLTDLTLLDDAEATLKEAADAIAALPESSRFPFLVQLADAQFDQADPDAAATTAAAAVALAASGSPQDRQRLASFFIRTGNWPEAMQIVASLPPDHIPAALRETLTTAAEDSLGYDPMAPPARGEPVDSIRKMAAGDENRVISLVERQPAGYPRARAWLAMAKGLLTGHSQDSLPPLQPPLPDDALPPPEGAPEPPPVPLAPADR